MSETLLKPEEWVEAVIISGPRRGEIVTIDLSKTPPQVVSLQDAFRALTSTLGGMARSADRLGAA